MKRLIAAVCTALCCTTLLAPATRAEAPGHYHNFRVAIYVVVDATKMMADPKVNQALFERAMSQTHFDKVYLEVYRNQKFATDAEIVAAKKFFEDHGVVVSGGITLAAGGKGGQFGTFDYEKAEDRAECQKAVELAAKYFDEVILDDFFFYTSKSDADIAAKGNRSWTQYRLETMRAVARDLVMGPAHRVNPRIKMIIKYPNWYEHFQGLGYDLDQEAQAFDAIYTGTETRDSVITDQLLQPYESYEVYRYFSNIRPGLNGGGWVDTYDTVYADRYAEQLWDTLFAKAPEITLFNWTPMSEMKAVQPGERDAWKNKPTSFNWAEMLKAYKPTQQNDAGPGWGQVAGTALATVDKVVGKLGKPIGIPSYKPYQSSGEDFLQNYLGTIGLPVEMTPTFPTGADLVLLTESAKFDPQIVDKIKAQLVAGKDVVITSGLLKALQDKGIQDITEIADTGRIVPVRNYFDGFGAGRGQSLDDGQHANPPVLFPEIHFYTNDTWPIIRGVAGPKGIPIMLMNRYSNGSLYELTVPQNPADLYVLPKNLLTKIKSYLLRDFPVRIDAPASVSLFAYDNDTFVVELFLPTDAPVSISVRGEHVTLRDLATDKRLTASSPQTAGLETSRPVSTSSRLPAGFEAPRTNFSITLLPHSFQAFQIER